MSSLPSTRAPSTRRAASPACRGRGIGRALAAAAIAAAAQSGYLRIVLDSLPKMHEALALYRLLGFRDCPPYLAEPTPGALCLELRV